MAFIKFLRPQEVMGGKGVSLGKESGSPTGVLSGPCKDIA